MRAIGIDLGTTNSLVAVADNREIKVLPTRAGEHLTPSVVSFVKKRKAEEGEIVVGRQAVANAVRAPEETVFSIKRLMGAVYGEPRVEEVRRHISYKLADPPPAAEDQGVKVILGGQTYSPVDISAMILKQVRMDAEQALGDSVAHAVITVPAYFEERQRDATKQAAKQAGLNVLKIIDEPTAAALFFGVGKEGERHRILVYDFGGGTFDISIIQMTGGQYQVLEITGDSWLGGDDLDRTIIARMIEWVKVEYNFDPSQDKDFLGKAKVEAEKVKIALGSHESAEIFAPLSVKIPNQGPVDIEMTVTREEFESDIRPLVDRTIELVNIALRNQNFTPDDITEVLLVGGSTSIPLVREAVVNLFGAQKVKRHVNPMECVALGAAILAGSHEIKEDTVVSKADRNVVEVTALHLGIAALKGDNPDAFVPIIEKGTPYPLSEPKKRLFTPVEENQKLIRVAVYEGLSHLASLNDQQGVIEFPLPRGIGAANPVEISFNFDANRVLTVGVRVVGTELVI
jgi:molecular chaperone DnaK